MTGAGGALIAGGGIEDADSAAVFITGGRYGPGVGEVGSVRGNGGDGSGIACESIGGNDDDGGDGSGGNADGVHGVGSTVGGICGLSTRCSGRGGNGGSGDWTAAGVCV